ncbi:MAG: putative retroelement protein [Lentinula lateritia]|nr:MAG: putative retroelement protein [Lentinula lateritia]
MAIDTTTRATYSSALNSYIKFCTLHNFSTEPMVNTFSFFIMYLSRHIKPDSIDSYLSGICSEPEHLYPNIRQIWQHPLIKCTLKGCKRLYSSAVKWKLPLSHSHIGHAIRLLPPSPTHDDILFTIMLLVGIYGLLCLAKLTMHSNPHLQNPRKYSRRSSVEWAEDSFSFWLPLHKADPTFEGNRILIQNPQAIQFFHHYMISRDTLFPTHPFLWVQEDGNILTRDWFLRQLHWFISDARISGQSLQAGSATALTEDGTAPNLIQAAGHWASEAFRFYIPKNPILLQAMLTNCQQNYP